MATNSSDVVAGTNATALVYNNLRKDHRLGISNPVTDTDGATVTFDLGTNGDKIHSVPLGGNRTLALANGVVGQAFVIRLIQGTGGQTVTWFSTIKWPFGLAPVLSTTSGKTDVFGFLCTSAGNYDGYILALNI